jgi:predicted glycosyltransferase
MLPRANIESFIIFQYLTGSGHLTRCSAIAQALSSISHVTMFSGGKPIESYSAPTGVDFVQLPAIHLGTPAYAFPVPVDPGYTMAEIEHMRSELLVQSYLRIKPKIVIVEFFPFNASARRFGKTLNKLFEAINKEQQRPIVICSIRTYPRPEWNTDIDPAWINEQLRENFTCILHHADPKLFPLTSLGSYIQTALSGITVRQTGFVRRPLTQMDHDRPSKGLLLTVGGGSALGVKLLKRWINAARAGSPDLFPINAVCGPLMDANDRKILYAEQDANITVHDWVANLDELIGSSRAVVCLGGYNTLVEALSLKKPVLAFPNSELGDQAFQINALHCQGMLLKGHQSQSDYEITALMNELLNFRPQHAIDCNGADRSVEIVKRLLSANAGAVDCPMCQ